MGQSACAIEVVQFHGDEIQAVRGEDEQVWVVVKRVCEALEIDDRSQRKRLDRCPWAVGVMMTATAPDGKTYQTFCLSLDSLPMWLATIDVKRVKAEARDKLIAYQRECAHVLRDHFFGRAMQPATISPMVLESFLKQNSQILALVQTVVDHFTDLDRRIAEVEKPSFGHGAITKSGWEVLKGLKKRIAVAEVKAGTWPNERAAMGSIDAELRDTTGWGGKSKPWRLLPAQLEQPAMAVLRRRMSEAERVAGHRQLGLFGTKPS